VRIFPILFPDTHPDVRASPYARLDLRRSPDCLALPPFTFGYFFSPLPQPRILRHRT
jgi:hypothetical protein